MTLSVVIAATVLLGAAGAWRWKAAGALRLGLAAPALFCSLFLVACSVAFSHSDSWSFIRLAPSIAMVHGNALYHPEGQGALLGWSYGPVMPLLNLPFAAFADPSTAVTASALLNAAMLLLPLLFAVWSVLPADPAGRVTGVVITAALHALLMHCVPSMYWFRRIQVDAFAMGFWLLGIVVLLAPGLSARRLWSAAALFVASAFSKHNETVLSVIPVALVWLKHGRLAALRMTLALGVLALAGLVLCVLTWGWDAVFLNLWLVPVRHPWAETGIEGLTIAAELFMDAARGAVMVFLAIAAADVRVGPRGPADRAWLIPAAAAVLIFPASLAGRIKVGGDDNSFHSVYFLAAAAGMILARWTAEPRPAALRKAVPVVTVLVAALGTAAYPRGPQPLDVQFGDSLLQREYRFAKEHPGEVWFGADPLVTLYTDGRAYHQGYGVFDRTLPNLPPTPRQLEAHLPARMRWVSSPPPPFWTPGGLEPIAAPKGLGGTLWYEVRR